MTITKDVSAKAAFQGQETKAQKCAPEVPERIRTHAPEPALRPGNSWAARADEIDRRVRESREAARARTSWKERQKAQKQGMRKSFGHSAS